MDVLKFLNGLKNGIAILIDPDKFSSKDELRIYLDKVSFANPDIVFIGGSTVSKIDFQNCVELSKEKINVWHKTYDDKLHLYFKNNYLVKDDQIIIIDNIMSNVNDFELVRENKGTDPWFVFQRFLL